LEPAPSEEGVMSQPRILPPTTESLTQLSAIGGHDRCVLTVLFAGDPRDGGAPKDIAELPEELVDAAGLTQDEGAHLQHSAQFWRNAVSGLSLPPAEGWLGVVSWLTEDAVFVPLPAAPKRAAYLDDSPFLLPAARLVDDYEPYAVVYANHDRAVIYLAALGTVAEEARLRGDIKNHVRKGGWSQQRYERRRDKQIHHYCRAIVDRLADLVRDEGLRRVALAGDRILLGELENRMPAALRERVVCRLAMEDKKRPHEVFAATLPLADEEEKREEQWLREAIREECARGGRAVTGATAVLAALKERRVRWLLVGPLREVSFWRCAGCGATGLGSEPACPECGQAAYGQSAANEFADLAFAGGSRVEFTQDPLDDLDGVGALLRW